MHTTNHSSKTCDVAEAFASTTIFKKRGEETSSGGQECYILKNNLGVPLSEPNCYAEYSVLQPNN